MQQASQQRRLGLHASSLEAMELTVGVSLTIQSNRKPVSFQLNCKFALPWTEPDQRNQNEQQSWGFNKYCSFASRKFLSSGCKDNLSYKYVMAIEGASFSTALSNLQASLAIGT